MLQTFFQSATKQILAKNASQLQRINKIGEGYLTLTDEQLNLKTQELKKRLVNGQKQYEIIDEAFALVREATSRVLKIRHYDVQLLGGLVLNEGKIAEMKTGEGKTIVALLPTFLNALYGKGTHVVTVNDYLARRDAEYVGQVHRFLGLTVGLIQENMSPTERKENYNCDVVYVTNNELGFDYLRDNMAFTSSEMVQRPFFFAVIDEVDSILIDEARTPLIISGPSEAPTQKYIETSKLAQILKRDVHYSVDEKNQNVVLFEEGIQFCEQALSQPDLYNPENPWISYILNSVKAKELFKLNTNYIVSEESEIVIVDEFTGRTMYGRRWSDPAITRIWEMEVPGPRLRRRIFCKVSASYFPFVLPLTNPSTTSIGAHTLQKTASCRHFFFVRFWFPPRLRPRVKTSSALMFDIFGSSGS